MMNPDWTDTVVDDFILQNPQYFQDYTQPQGPKVLVLCATTKSIAKKRYRANTKNFETQLGDDFVYAFVGNNISGTLHNAANFYEGSISDPSFLMWVKETGPYHTVLDENCGKRMARPELLHKVCLAGGAVLASSKKMPTSLFKKISEYKQGGSGRAIHVYAPVYAN